MAHTDVMVGLDFGMTTIGVAIFRRSRLAEIRNYKTWSSNSRGGIVDKVDSKIAYDDWDDVAGSDFTVNESYGGST